MEKKNMVLLTVIAVATLLVAVVGATFAYFTATVSTTNDENKTTTVKARTLASASMDYGSKIQVDNALPGWKGIKELHVTGSGEDGSDPITATIKIDLSATAFNNHVKYTLYKSSTKIEDLETQCQQNPHASSTDGKYFDEMTCDPSSMELSTIQGNINASTSTSSSTDITVTNKTDEYYYLFVEYENAEEPQNTEQGQTFTVDLSFTAKTAA